MRTTEPCRRSPVAALALLLAVSLGACGDQAPAAPPAAPADAARHPTETVRVNVESADPGARVRVTFGFRGGAGKRPADVKAVVAPPGAEVEIPAGLEARAFAECDGGLVWPRSAPVGEDLSVRFRVEPHRRVRLVASDGGPASDVSQLLLVPDRFAVPQGDAARVEALQVAVDLLRPAVVTDGAGPPSVLLPATTWWCFGTTGGGPVATRLDANAATLVLGAAPTRTLTREPTVDGAPIPLGTLVAPGRLDLLAAAALAEHAVRPDFERRFAAAFVRQATAWRPVALPAADVLTLYHPSFGLAYVPWADGDPPDGRPEPGAIEFRSADGAPFGADVGAWPTWCGDGGAFSRPPHRSARVVREGVASIVLRGLPLGTWRWDAAPAGGGADRLSRGTVTLDAARPHATVSLAAER